jgi:hypothetical protein
MNSRVHAQGTESRRITVTHDRFYLGFNVSPVQTSIFNENFKSTTALLSKSGNSINPSLEIGYFFSRIAGISIGAEYSSYSAKLVVDSTSIIFQDVDSEDENFEMRIQGKSLTENQKISVITIPVCLNLRFKAGAKMGFYLKAGVSLSIPVEKSYNGSGIFSYSGYYSEYPVLLQDLPEYGFPINQNTKSSGELQLQSFHTDVTASGGITLSLNNKITMLLGANFSKSLGNISAYKPDPEFRLTSKADDLNSIMAGSSGAGLQSVGLNIGFRYYLK